MLLKRDMIKVFAETASGINENRQKLKKLLSMVASGEVDVVLIEFKEPPDGKSNQNNKSQN